MTAVRQLRGGREVEIRSDSPGRGAAAPSCDVLPKKSGFDDMKFDAQNPRPSSSLGPNACIPFASYYRERNAEFVIDPAVPADPRII